MKYLKIITLFSLMASFLTSCHKDLEQPPLSSLTIDQFFNTLDEAEIAVNGIYDVFGQQYHQYYIKMTDHGSHVSTTFQNNQNQNKFAFYTFTSGDRDLEDIWFSAYKGIYRANTVLNRLNTISVDPNDLNAIRLKSRLKGEAKFLRSLLYFNLVRFWGDVPLVTEELLDFNNEASVYKAKTASTLIYDQIISDLLEAEQSLYHASWVAAGDAPSYTEGDRGRATIGAAKGLLSKVYLTRASWPLNQTEYLQDAYDKSLELINDSHYELDSDYHHLLTPDGENSKEWLFMAEFNYSALQGSVYGGFQNPAGSSKSIDYGFGRVSPTLKFYNKFDPTDARITSIAKGRKFKPDNSITLSNNTKQWTSYKYRFQVKPQGRFITDMNAPILRFADILLINAEAANELGMEAEALTSLNRVLKRARDFGVSLDASAYGAAPVDVLLGNTKEDLREIIFWERAKELAFEGHSKLDLIRAGETKFLEELSEENQKWTWNHVKFPEGDKTQTWVLNVAPFKMLYPIPEAELGANYNLSQNPGY